jgi:hypothetical protein
MRIPVHSRCALFLILEKLGEIDEYAGAGGEDDIAAGDGGGSVVGYGGCSCVRKGFGPGYGAGGEGVDGVGGGGVDGVGVDGDEAACELWRALQRGELRECGESGELRAGGVVDDGSSVGRVGVASERAECIYEDSVVVDPAYCEAIDCGSKDTVFVDAGGGAGRVLSGGDRDERAIRGEKDWSASGVDARGWMIGPDNGRTGRWRDLAGVVEVQTVVGAEVLAERGA